MYYYNTPKGIVKHFDSHGGNNGDEGAPIYSLSLGNTCNFRYSHVGVKEEETHDISLTSGDLLVFGGPQRLMHHMVTHVDMNSCSDEDCHNAMINLTFRTCTGFTDEDEAKYKTKNYMALMQAGYAK